jgi:uncharacterized protein (DUF1778 family)
MERIMKVAAISAARSAVEETLLDQAIRTVSAAAYKEFVSRLDQTPRPNVSLRKTMRTPAPWDEAKDRNESG